jgi:hypothetical protein
MPAFDGSEVDIDASETFDVDMMVEGAITNLRAGGKSVQMRLAQHLQEPALAEQPAAPAASTSNPAGAGQTDGSAAAALQRHLERGWCMLKKLLLCRCPLDCNDGGDAPATASTTSQSTARGDRYFDELAANTFPHAIVLSHDSGADASDAIDFGAVWAGAKQGLANGWCVFQQLVGAQVECPQAASAAQGGSATVATITTSSSGSGTDLEVSITFGRKMLGRQEEPAGRAATAAAAGAGTASQQQQQPEPGQQPEMPDVVQAVQAALSAAARQQAQAQQAQAQQPGPDASTEEAERLVYDYDVLETYYQEVMAMAEEQAREAAAAAGSETSTAQPKSYWDEFFMSDEELVAEYPDDRWGCPWPALGLRRACAPWLGECAQRGRAGGGGGAGAVARPQIKPPGEAADGGGGRRGGACRVPARLRGAHPPAAAAATTSWRTTTRCGTTPMRRTMRTTSCLSVSWASRAEPPARGAAPAPGVPAAAFPEWEQAR